MDYSSKCPCHPEPLPIGNYRDEELEVVQGGMGDYNYMHHGCMEFTIEVTAVVNDLMSLIRLPRCLVTRGHTVRAW